MRENPWILSTFVLGIFVLILMVGSFGGITGGIVDEGVAGDALAKLAKEQIGDIEILNVEQESGLYKIFYSSEQGSSSAYLTLDGKNLVNGLIPISSLTQQTTEQPTTTGYSEDELQELRIFNDCLADNGMVIYGSDTCPHCRTLVSLLGGYDVASSVFVECGKNRERCNEETQTNYVPEIQLNGEIYEGGKTLESLGEATGCSVPQVN